MPIFLPAKKHKIRCIVYVFALMVSMDANHLQRIVGEEDHNDTSSLQPFGVLCRWIDVQGAMVFFPKLKLPENQKETVSSTTVRPFVVGATPEGRANRPHIVAVHDGLWVEISLVGRRSDGASVDITVEQSKIGRVETKKVGDDLTIQQPRVDIIKKRVLDFLKYGEVFSIPIGDKGSISHVELIIQADVKTAVPASWIMPAKEISSDAANAKQAEILGNILASGGAELRYEKKEYSVKLFDTPVLLWDIRLLSGIRKLQNLTITAKDHNYTLMHELTRVYVQHDLELLNPKGEKKMQSEEIGEDRLVWHLHHDAPGYAKLTLEESAPPVFSVYVDEAEAAIPTLQKTAHVKQVLIIGVYDGDAPKAAQAKQLMQKALPNMKIETIVFTGGNRPMPQ